MKTSSTKPRPGRPAGLTLVELLSAMALMVIITGVLAGLSSAVLVSHDYNRGVTDALQHGRVAMDRITRAVTTAHASEDDPGVAVVEAAVGSWRFPDMLVVWNPTGEPANPDGPPLLGELVIFCPDPDFPNRLVEVTARGDSTPAPLEELNGAGWRQLLEDVVSDPASKKVVLTSLLRTGNVSGGGNQALRGAARFERRLSPSMAAWQEFRAGNVNWSDLDWPQGIASGKTGLRQVWVRIELQVMQGAAAAQRGSGDPVPHFGTATVYDQLEN